MSGKKNFLPEKINSSKENYTIDDTGCSSSFRGALHQKNKTTKAAIVLAAFVDLKAKYKYLILLQGS